MRTVPGARMPETWDASVLARLTDDEVVALLGAPEARSAAATALLASDHLAGPWTGPHGVVQVRLDLPDGTHESWTLRSSPAGLALAERADPDVQLRVPLLALVRMVTGRADAALLHLAGVLDVVGDASLVLAWGARLRPPGSDRPVLDADALDPEAVAAAIAGVRTEHLSSVMAGGFRSLVLDQVFARLPQFLIRRKAAGARVAVRFSIGGRPDGGRDSYVVRVVDGTCAVTTEGAQHSEEAVDATLVLEGHQFLRLVLGQLNPVRGVLSGEVEVQGHVLKALAFHSLMRIPGR